MPIYSNRIGTNIAAGGEPCPPRSNVAVPQEVVWGQNLRDRHTKQSPLRLKPKSFRDVPRSKPEKQVVLRPEPMKNLHLKRLYQSKLLDGSKVVNRFALSPKQHIKLLAVPKKHPYCTHVHHPVLKHVKGCSPRLLQLSVPYRNSLLSTFVNYKDILPIEKIDKLYETLQYNPIMNVPDAENYFEDEERAKLNKIEQSKRRERRQAIRRQRQMTIWINRVAEGYASRIIEYLKSKTLLHSSHIERIFSNQILATFKKNGKIDRIPSRKSHLLFQREVLQVSDQAAHFAINIIIYLDNKQTDWGDESTSTVTTITTTGVPMPPQLSESVDIPEDDQSFPGEVSIHIEKEEPENLEEDFGESEKFYNEIMKTPSKAELNSRMTALVSILENLYETSGNDETMRVFDSDTLPLIKFQELLETTQDLHTSGAITGSFEELVHELRKKITAYIQEIEPEMLDAYMQAAINMVARELAKAKFEEFINLSYKPEQVEVKEEEEKVVTPPISFPSESLQPSMKVSEFEDIHIKRDVQSPGSAAYREQALSVASSKTASSIYDQPDEETFDEYIFTETISKCPPLTIMPHSPTMVCCASVQAWALWTKDVADNARNWCTWIHQTIGELRHMAAVVRGEVIEPDGSTAVLRREEWNNFVIQLDADVVRWRAYNQHVQSVTDEIIEHFRDKKVECCAKCLEEGYDLYKLEAEHLSEQLLDALSTTQYWRKWLNGMVNEATVLTNIIEVPDEMTILDYSTGHDVSLVADAMVLIVATHDEPDSQSFYSIERVNSHETKDKK